MDYQNDDNRRSTGKSNSLPAGFPKGRGMSLKMAKLAWEKLAFGQMLSYLPLFEFLHPLYEAITEMWDWQGEDYSLQTNDSNSLWSNVNENLDDLCCVFNEATPPKSFDDLAYQVTNNEKVSEGTEPCTLTYSQAKRRRMLQFDDEDEDVDILSLCDEDTSSVYLKSKDREASMDESLSDMSQWVAGFAGLTHDTSASGSGYEGLDQSSEGWLADCLINDTEMSLSVDDLNLSESTAVQIDTPEQNDSHIENRGRIGQELSTPTLKMIKLKGKKSFIETPVKLATSVVLPFTLVKPCGLQGTVTLKDINQRILTPPPKQPHKDPTTAYPTSAFSGKPVVGKTKIHTEGGKGSITIMRTKG